MKLNYDPAADMLHISFGKGAEVEGFDLCDGVVVHLDAEENVAGIEIENASARADLEELQAVAKGQEPPARPNRKDVLLAPEPRTERLTPPRSQANEGRS